MMNILFPPGALRSSCSPDPLRCIRCLIIVPKWHACSRKLMTEYIKREERMVWSGFCLPWWCPCLCVHMAMRHTYAWTFRLPYPRRYITYSCLSPVSSERRPSRLMGMCEGIVTEEDFRHVHDMLFYKENRSTISSHFLHADHCRWFFWETHSSKLLLRGWTGAVVGN